MDPPIILSTLIAIFIHCCCSANIPEEFLSSTPTSEFKSGDCTVENIIYSNGGKVPSPGPCEECHCQSSQIVCAMIKCKPNTSGCKVIQQANQCCPQYKCECELNDHIYNNGERLERPDDPCRVCYCKGGEVMCTTISCYERQDCTPTYVKGQCCPKYDHCPIDNGNNNGQHYNSSASSGKREMQPWLMTASTNSNNNQTAASSINVVTEPAPVPQPANKYPQTIRIIEILPTQPSVVQHRQEAATTESSKEDGIQLLTGIDAANSTEDLEAEKSTHRVVDSIEESQHGNVTEIFDESEESSRVTNRTDSELITMIDDVENVKLVQGQTQASPSVQNEIDDSVNITESDEMNHKEYTEESPLMINDQKVESSEFKAILTSGEYSHVNSATITRASDEENSAEEIVDESSSASSNNDYELLSSSSTESSSQPNTRSEKLSIPEHDLTTSNDGFSFSVDSSKQPDSMHYTSVIPEQFQNSNELQLNTEVNELETTEGSGYELISGWMYEDASTSEASQELRSHQHDNINVYSSEPPIHQKDIITTENELYAATSESSVTTMENTSQPTTDRNLNGKSTITFPSILKLNDHVQFLKIQNQQQNLNNNDQLNEPIAKIGIYSPDESNNMTNLVTVVKENNLELEQRYNTEHGHREASSGEHDDYTPHILLTPNDLKKLAEILIHERILSPFSHNDERSTNTIDQRSIKQNGQRGNATDNDGDVEEVSLNSGEVRIAEVTTDVSVKTEVANISVLQNSQEIEDISVNSEESSTNSSEESDVSQENIDEQSSSISSVEVSPVMETGKVTLNMSKLVEIIDIREHYEENSTTTPRSYLNLTDEEKWAQSVIDKVESNILLPLQGVEIVDPNNVTSSESEEESRSSSTESILQTNTTFEELSKENSSEENITDENTTEFSIENQYKSSTTVESSETEQSPDEVHDLKSIRLPKRSLLSLRFI